MVTKGILHQCEPELAIEGEGIYFYFNKKQEPPLLNDLNIAVKRGSIYSLLGPSGCGKTTLLKCVIGQNKIYRGSLKIYGKAPGSKGLRIPGPGVGYMPQDLALHGDMTIEETLAYFGALYFMKKGEINERIDFLINLLALPTKKRKIKYLSGGQQRRVSFATALVHKPPLLILDEPTVGVDPRLRQAIWKHLFNLAQNEGLTIIITTHYIEEARQAHMVGLMRNGQLLAERNPEDLIRKYRATTLEEVFLRLCQNKEKEDEEIRERENGSLTSVISVGSKASARNDAVVWTKKDPHDVHMNVKYSNPGDYKCNGAIDEIRNGTTKMTTFSSPHSCLRELSQREAPYSEFLARFLCLTKKNLVCFKRNYVFLIFQTFLPALLTVVFCLCVGGFPFHLPVSIAAMEKDAGSLTEDFIRALNNHTIIQKESHNLTLALESVKNADTWAAIYTGPEFGICLADRILEGADVANETIECSTISLYSDMSLPQIHLTIYFDLLKSTLKFAREVLERFGKNPRFASLPLTIQDPPVYGSLTTSFTEFMTPGQILGITYIVAVCLTGMAVLMERKQGLLERTLVAGASSGEVMLSLFATLLLTLLIQIVLVLLCIFVVFHIPCQGPIFWVVICFILVGTTGMAYGLLVSSICDDEYTACFLALGTFFLNIPPSGIIWSLEGMPYYVRYVSYCLPLTLITDSLRSIFVRGRSITHPDVWDGYVVCITWTVLFLVLAVIFFKIKK